MNFYGRRFNLILLLAAGLALVCGCETLKKKMHRGPVAQLRIHIESQANAPGTTQAISLLRSQPVNVTIANDPILTEANIVAARIVDTGGGFVVDLKFDDLGTWALEQYSAINPGKHLVIFGHWGDKPEDGRWLAAPQIKGRSARGELSFTPDASREEMEQFVKGLENDAKENAGMRSKQ
jgi:hypothetical protein